ncbi:MAG: hypothetical protein U0470_02740 [Anaerolineae bacterium]
MDRSLGRDAAACLGSLIVVCAFAVRLHGSGRVRAQSPAPHKAYLPLSLDGLSLADAPEPVVAPPTALPAASATASATTAPSATAIGTPEPATPTATEAAATATPALPAGRIAGRVTSRGTPVAKGMGAAENGPRIELRRRQQGRWQPVATATVGDDGRFAFENAPPLAAGEAYQVWWDVDPNLFLTEWLTRWMTREIPAFGAGDEVDVGTLEVADTIELTKPDNNWWSTLPVTFGWRGRSLPRERYRWTLSRRCGNDSNDIDRENGFRSDAFDRQTTYKLDAVPPGFQYRTKYCWYMTIEGADGGTGWSGYYRKIEFRTE